MTYIYSATELELEKVSEAAVSELIDGQVSQGPK